MVMRLLLVCVVEVVMTAAADGAWKLTLGNIVFVFVYSSRAGKWTVVVGGKSQSVIFWIDCDEGEVAE